MTTTQQPARLTLGIAAASALAAALPATVLGLRATPDLFGAGLRNPDSAMRLVRLHDILAAGRPLHAVLRDGDGTVLHWSHLLDSLLLLMAAPFASVLGWDRALHAVGLLLGPLSLAALGIAVAWAALPCLHRDGAGRGWAWLAAVAIGASPALQGYGMTGVVHHHVLLALCAVMASGWALRALTGADPRVSGMALGAWAAAGLWLSPESLPFSLMALGALWVGWLADPAPRLRSALLAASSVFLLVTSLAWAVDPPGAGWLAAEPDRISLPFVLLALGATLTAGAARSGRRAPVLCCGAVAALLWLLAFPQVLRGTEGLMEPEQALAFFGHITEMQPVHGLPEAVEALLGGLFATVALAAMAWRRRACLPLHYATACAAGVVALAAAHVRFAPYPAVAGAVLLPVVLAAITRSAVAPALLSFARVGLVLPVLLAPLLAPLAAKAARPVRAACPIGDAAALLANHPGAIVLADVNETPDLLYRTPVRTVGSLYHRNPAAFMRLREAWRSVPDGDAPPLALRATGATLILACPGAARSALVADLPPTTLQDRLVADRPPAWLHRLADAGPGGHVLYAVAP